MVGRDLPVISRRWTTVTSNKAALEFKRNIARYLDELSKIAGRSVLETELTPLDQTGAMRDADIDRRSKRIVEIPFELKSSPQFGVFVDDLCRLNPSPVFVWTPRTRYCGAFRVDSVKHINFGFPFSLNPEGIISLSTSDLCDEMVLDFSETNAGMRVLEVELVGVNWSKAFSTIASCRRTSAGSNPRGSDRA